MDIDIAIDLLHQTGLFPDKGGWINVLLFLIIFAGFVFIVLRSKKYKHLLDLLDDYF